MEFLAWIEQTGLSRFIREDFYAYFVLLIFHAWGMAFLVGGGLAICLRLMGVAPGTRVERFRAFLPVMAFGALLAIPSGLGLLWGYPAKALTNWIFPLKLVCLAVAAWLVVQALRLAVPAATEGAAVPRPAQNRAAVAMGLWLGGVACGKLLLYTNTMLLTTDLVVD